MSDKINSKYTHSMPTGLEIGKIPPQNVELEEAILGGIMLEKEAMEEIVDILVTESFYRDEHQKIYAACLSLFNTNKPIDLRTVTEELRKRKELEIVGGPVYLSGLTMNIASAAHIEYHARIVQQKFIQRELIRVSTEIQNKAFDESIDIDDLMEYSLSEINKITTGTLKKMARRMSEIGRDRLIVLEKLYKEEIKTIGVKCWKKLDDLTGGWQNPDYIILAARPSMGKTRMAQEIGKLAAQDGNPVLFFSLEMKDEQLYDRELSNETGIENMYIRKADFRDTDWPKIDAAQGIIEGLDFYIDDTPALTVNEFRAKARLYKKKYGIKLFIIDYLQLMKNPEYKKFREQEISSISGTIKTVAKELDVPIIALCQLSRDLEKRSDKTPQLSDLRESGSLEQDADAVIFIHRPEVYEKDEISDKNKNLIELIIAKFRNGSIGIVRLWKSDKWTRIFEHKNDIQEPKTEDIF